MKVPHLEVWREPIDNLMVAVFAQHRWEGGERPTVWMLMDRSLVMRSYGPYENEQGERVYGHYELRSVPKEVSDKLERDLKRVEQQIINEYGRGWLDRWRDDKASASQHRNRRAENACRSPGVGAEKVA